MSTIPKEIQEKVERLFPSTYEFNGVIQDNPLYRTYRGIFLDGYQLATDGREELEKDRDWFMAAHHSLLKESSEQITALQSQCTDKDSRIAGLIYATEQWEKKCTEKDQEIEKIKMARESYKSQAEHFSDSLEELKAENERLKKSLEFRISRS